LIESLFQIGLIVLVLSVFYPLAAFIKESGLPRTLSNASLIISSALLAAASILQLLDGGDVALFGYQLTPGLALTLSLDRLSSFFVLVISVVALSVGVFTPATSTTSRASAVEAS